MFSLWLFGGLMTMCLPRLRLPSRTIAELAPAWRFCEVEDPHGYDLMDIFPETNMRRSSKYGRKAKRLKRL